MSTGWENHEPAPLEYFHGKLMDAFHALRQQKGDNPEKTLTLTGIEFSDMIAKIKIETYRRYPHDVSNKPIPKNKMVY
jgi:hypothetical protein